MQIFRFYYIIYVVLSYGLDELIPKKLWPWWARLARMSLFWIRNKHKPCSDGERIRLAAEKLGPVYVKLGQMLSTRRDLLPPDMVEELIKLQDQVAPFDGVKAKAVIEAALGAPVEDLFHSFEIEPLASASIAQVHAAELIDKKTQECRSVVVKVIRPGIEDVIHADLSMLYMLARLAEKLLPDGRRLKPVEVIQEYQKTLLNELNLAKEAANGIQLRRNFSGSDLLYVPEIYSEYSRQSVLVMERIHGIPISDVERIQAAGIPLQDLAERGVELFFTQVFRDSFFHADMHPGNIFVDPTVTHPPRYLAIDFGIIGTLNREDKRYLAANFLAFFNRDYRKVAELHVDSGWVPAHINIEDFESEIRTVCEPIFEKPLEEISFGHVLLHLFSTARRFEMQVQPQLVLLQKTLLYVEGLGRHLYPQLDLWKTAKPYLESWMKEQLGWRALVRHIQEQAPMWTEQLPELPGLVHDVLANIKTDREYLRQYIANQAHFHFLGMRCRWWMVLGASLTVATAIAATFKLAAAPLTVILAGSSAFAWLRARVHYKAIQQIGK